MAQTFLIRYRDQFLKFWDGESTPVWTSVPSLAAHLSYPDADEGAQDLQELGITAVVCDRFGNPATIDVIRREVAPTLDGGTF